jgi:hypothetical protein
MFGGFSSEHFWIDGHRLRAVTKASQRGKARAAPERGSSIAQPVVNRGVGIPGWFMNEIARSKKKKNVVSLQAARERRRQLRGDSNRHVSKGLLERLEAENAQLRDCVIELMLEIQALHDGAK